MERNATNKTCNGRRHISARYYIRDWSFMMIGSVLSLMPLLNLGCCSAGSCNTPTFRNTKMKESKNIKYEEVH